MPPNVSQQLDGKTLHRLVIGSRWLRFWVERSEGIELCVAEPVSVAMVCKCLCARAIFEAGIVINSKAIGDVAISKSSPRRRVRQDLDGSLKLKPSVVDSLHSVSDNRSRKQWRIESVGVPIICVSEGVLVVATSHDSLYIAVKDTSECN